ncbi:ATP synthase subunit a [Bienertia sinuspersici]
MKIGNLYFSFTNPSLFMLLTLSLVLLLLHFVTKKGGGKEFLEFSKRRPSKKRLNREEKGEKVKSKHIWHEKEIRFR